MRTAVNEIFWARRAEELRGAQAEIEALRATLRRHEPLLDLIGRLASELEYRQFGEYGCLSCHCSLHTAACPLRLALAQAAELVPNDNDP